MSVQRRAIYPTMATSLSLARCTIGAQLLFDRLIAAADDQGRLQGDPLLVRAQCMPLIDRATIKAVDGWLNELQTETMVIRYSANGQPLIQIANWWAHQGWLRHLRPSRWPAPDGYSDQLKGHGMADKRPLDGGQVADDQRTVGGPDSDSDVDSDVDVDLDKSLDVDVERVIAPPTDEPLNFSLHRITTNHRDLTTKLPNAKAVEMYSDLIQKFGADTVAQAQYRCANFDPKDYGFVGRVKTECKRLAA